ncbi:hypothetical protein CVS40_10086 [Lucilia cuprina]|nr:hypothetical protein CVS40_10086 [Lucilia cuprina]
MFKYGVWGYTTLTGVMGAVLLDPTNTANLENFVGDSDAGLAFKKLMFSNDRYRRHAEAMLPWLKNRENYTMADERNCANEAIPKWIEAQLFEKLLEDNVENYKSINKFIVKPGIGAGENYATVMLKVEIEVQLKDLSTKSLCFMLKVNHEKDQLRELLKGHDVFDAEKSMYDEIIPAFEKLYADVGVEVKFGPKSYDLATKEEYILLENLCVRGFKNANRLEGLDMEHTKCVLKKLAQWHAASAVFVTVKGQFEEKYIKCYFHEEGKESLRTVFEGMGKVFKSCAKNYSNYEEYAADIEALDNKLVDELYKTAIPDPNEFNVLNHGDCWSNNVMFQYDAFGNIKETYLIDLQMPKYGTPAQDLYYFLISSTKYEIKIKQFDYFIKFYHDNLVENLKLLKYNKKIPLLKDIHIMLFKYGIWGYSTATGVMSAVLLEPTNTASLENFVGDSDASLTFKKLIYSNDRYQTNGTHAPVPKWIEAKLFENLLQQNIENFKNIKEFIVKPGAAVGENYATVMLKVEIEVELKDLSTKSLSFMLKVNHDNEQIREMMKGHDIFDIEKCMYDDIVPAFEKLYADVGVKVNFGAKSYNLPTKQQYILLENLCPRGFKNANRLEGLDVEHTKCVLKKLAQWHAASAVLVEKRGPYEKKYLEGYFQEETKELMRSMFEGMGHIFIDCAKNYSNYNEYAEDLNASNSEMIDEFYKVAKHNPKEFNVLNHGDCWSNNVMFQYDAFGRIKETYLIDFQMAKYGSPAQDLFYFLLSSTQYEIKINKFDYFIKYYHDNLVENLKLLKYSQRIPSLTELHSMLYKYGIWGYSTVTGVMGAVLLDPTDNANLENFLGDSDAGSEFKKLMYSNDRYRKHAEALLPWLRNRGAMNLNESSNNMEPQQNGIAADKELPQWLDNVTLEKAIRQQIGDYKNILEIKTENSSKEGENYSSLMMRIKADVEMEDGSKKTASFILKTQHSNEMMARILNMLRLFPKEEEIYHKILPKFEQLYKEAGKSVQFAPNSYTFDRDIGVDYVLLEDLHVKKFKNANRLEGLDMDHVKEVLIKMAEFHAASACYVEHYGMFGEDFTVGIFSEKNKELLKEFNASAAFLSQLKKWKNCQQYYEKLADSDEFLVDRLLEDQKVNPREFNVLNHGDCWSNNIMFQYDAFGKIKNTLFVDFQVGKYGSPANDLYYFILSSAKKDIKLTQFDYMIRFYYEHLVENLKLLQYHRPLPKLKNIHIALMKNGLAAYMVVSKVLPVVILEKTDQANLENYIHDESKMKTAMFSNHNFFVVKQTVIMSPNTSSGKIVNPNEYLDIPKWINEDYFLPILEKDVNDFKCITKFTPIAATAPGENYTSIMVRVIIDVELKDGSSQEVSYILKTVLDASNSGAAFVTAMNLFPKEKQMYANYIPKFEGLYKNIGMEIKLGPKCIHFDETPEKITLVMEDLKRKDFGNIDRLKGFDMNHMKIVLHKLAEFHAASAVYEELNGPYESIYNASFFTEANRPMFAALYEPRSELFKKALLEWGLEDVERYIDRTPTLDEYFDENVFLNTPKSDEFNVLNHGDCWSNNIMFTHDEDGNVKESLFVDFQICKWGSPVQDLWYVISTSVSLDIKIKEFDHFIQIYHTRLMECLKMLKYSKAFPSLKELHINMLKYAVFTANTICPAILFPSDKDANMDNFMKPGPEGDAFRFKCFTNPIYVKAMLQFYPFLDNKGIFDITTKKN